MGAGNKTGPRALFVTKVVYETRFKEATLIVWSRFHYRFCGNFKEAGSRQGQPAPLGKIDAADPYGGPDFPQQTGNPP